MFKNSETNRHNTWHESELKCPYCGTEQSDTWEIGGDGGEDDEQTWECYNCQKEFTFHFETERVWTSSCIKHRLVTDVNKEPEEVAGKDCRYYYCQDCDRTAWLTEEEAEEESASIIEDERYDFKGDIPV